MAEGDLDGDLDVDLVVGPFDGNEIVLLFNAGDGTFPVTRNIVVDAVADVREHNVALGDLDGDSDLDIVVASLFTDVSVLLNQGGGDFSPPATVDVGPFPWGLALGDLDGDGTVSDLIQAATAGSSNRIVFVARVAKVCLQLLHDHVLNPREIIKILRCAACV